MHKGFFHTTRSHNGSFTTQRAAFMGPTWGPPGSCRPQVGPMFAPINFAIRVLIESLPGPTYFMVWANVVPVSSTWVATVHISREPKNTRIWRCQCHTSTFTRGFSWWRHQMETFSALLAICARNSPVSGEFPAKRPVTRSFDIDLRLNKRLSKQSWGWWFETLSCPL